MAIRLLSSGALVLGLTALVAPAVAALSDHDMAGAITLSAQSGPDYLGSRDRGISLRPGFYLRWGRVSVSSGGSWAARRQDAELSGLGIELVRSEDVDVTLGLRVDSGRRESASPALAGMGAVRRTIRARIGTEWRFTPGWQVGASWTVDAFNRGGGDMGELHLKHEWPLSARMMLNSGIAVTAGGDQYMQTYYGVTAEQSATSGYRVYTPSLGLRDVNLYTSIKYEVNDSWVLTGGPGITRLVGPAARSPLTQRKLTWTLSGGAAYRF